MNIIDEEFQEYTWEDFKEAPWMSEGGKYPFTHGSPFLY